MKTIITVNGDSTMDSLSIDEKKISDKLPSTITNKNIVLTMGIVIEIINSIRLTFNSLLNRNKDFGNISCLEDLIVSPDNTILLTNKVIGDNILNFGQARIDTGYTNKFVDVILNDDRITVLIDDNRVDYSGKTARVEYLYNPYINIDILGTE